MIAAGGLGGKGCKGLVGVRVETGNTDRKESVSVGFHDDGCYIY